MLPVHQSPRPDLLNVRNLDLAPMAMLRHMMRVGTAVDLSHLKSLSEELGDKKSDLEREIRKRVPAEAFAEWKGVAETNDDKDDESGESVDSTTSSSSGLALDFNINSPEQVAWFIFDMLKLGRGRNLKRTPDGKRVSTGKKQLETLKSENEVVQLLLDYREAAKLKSTYADALPKRAVVHPKGKCPVCSAPGREVRHQHSHRRIHTTFTTTRTETGRIASKAPNLQNIPKRTKVGKKIRAAFIPQPGMRWVSADFSQIELRILAHYSKDPFMRRIYAEGGDIHLRTALEAFHVTDYQFGKMSVREREAFLSVQRLAAKSVNFGVCIAKGQPVLTNQGLVPIEKVNRQMLVWDGVEFVRHEGVVYKGHKKVITHDGLQATPEHKVWTKTRGKCSIETASTLGLELVVTESQGNPIRYVEDHLDRDILCQRLPLCSSGMLSMPHGEDTSCGQHPGRENHQLLVQEEVQRSTGVSTARPLLVDESSLFGREQIQQGVEELRRQGNTLPVPVGGGVRELRVHQSSAPDLSRRGHRPDRQRRPLCAGEHPASRTVSQPAQHTAQQLGVLQGEEGSGGGSALVIGEGLSTVQTVPINNGTLGRPRNTVERDTEPAATAETYAHVYDIMNAGPRRRFTVAGKLVSNCYGLTAQGLQAQLALSQLYWSEEECQQFIDRWFEVFTGVHEYMNVQRYRAKRYGYVWDMWGRIRYCPGVTSVHRRIVEEALREAGNMPIQASSAGMTKLAMAEMWERDVDVLWAEGVEVNPLLTIHDEVIYEAPEWFADDLLALNIVLMSNVTELDHVPILADGKVADRW